MKRNVFMKAILISVVIALFALVVVGCAPITGTVYLVVGGYSYYYLYMDYIGLFFGVVAGTYALYDVPIGNHYFEAIDIDGAGWGYDSITQYITAGVNYVYLYP